ncbi:MogA/MoaB family molybdenum cofactor biosynthesis protein [Bacillus horti]|uniref:Molybdenum cofactor synthesis domain-containing protein n=1 Tax=Caldalkalibacillus horti TaxID=77523 RepID=A0ABT9W4W0_9BACI|nr:MogA/MoaB family molybdenum cofactor biosynthesis protein [Bacillus horti]MDQ0168291.1 molybdenum cofactor synthesis domain-containing protein [Bacillus horti]
MWKVALITASNSASRGEKEDDSGPVIQELIQRELSCEVMGYRVLPDCIETLKENMIELIDRHKADLLITIGGTSVSPEDVTPEATRQVIDRAIPGMAEEMRRKALELTRYAMLTRALCGTRGNALIINLPGTAQAAKYCLESVMDQLDNALLILHGKKREVLNLGGESE